MTIVVWVGWIEFSVSSNIPVNVKVVVGGVIQLTGDFCECVFVHTYECTCI